MTWTWSAAGFLVVLVAAPVVQGQYGWSVTYDSTKICATEGSTVEISCSYKYPSSFKGTTISITNKFWFTRMNDEEHVDLESDSKYKNRVSYSCSSSGCTLTISNVKKSDSAVYRFRLTSSHDDGRFTGEPGVTLSVTDDPNPLLQVTRDSYSPRLHCQIKCFPPSNHRNYVWYKNGQRIDGETSASYVLYSSDVINSFSCSLKGHEDFPSKSICVYGHYCNRVTYSHRSICASKGSSVDISCTYNSYRSVSSRFWFRPDRSGQSPSQPEDLGADSLFTGRIEVIEAEGGRSTLRITELTERDSGQYRFTFRAGGFEWGSSLAGTTLTVTDPDLQVLVWRSSYSSWSKLTCYSSCRLPDGSSYIWYKNGGKLTQTQQQISPSISGADSFSCALSGREDFPSASVCIWGEACNRVIYSDRSICASKGSSVNISCTYNSYEQVSSRFWFRPDRSGQWWSPSQPEDLGADSQFPGRVEVVEAEGGRSTLRITELTERDSGQYRFTFRAGGFEWGSSLAGTTLTVTALQVQVITATVQDSSTEAELRCLSSCSSAARLSYVWFKNGQKVTEEDDSYRDSFSPGDAVACALKGRENYKSASVYAPELPSVSVSPSGEIVEGSSVTLTCSTDANPAANYTWYQTDSHPESIHEGPQLVFSSIQSSDSGQFYCTAENQLGRRRSESVSVDVQYGPTSVNISVSPSGEIVEGSSVTLTCSTDANPTANYTWYKEDEESPTASGQSFTITDVRAEHSGKYSCDAWNSRGRRSSTVHLTVAGWMKSAAVGSVSVVIVLVLLVFAFLWVRKKRLFKRAAGRVELRRTNPQLNAGPQYDCPPAAAHRKPAEQQEDVFYASVSFPQSRDEALYSNVGAAQTYRRSSEEAEEVEYTMVNVKRAGPSPGLSRREAEEDSSALYSIVNRHHRA